MLLRARDIIYVIVPDNEKITYNPDNESTDKTQSIANKEGRALVKKKVLTLRSMEIATINKSDIYDTYKDLYFSEKEYEEKLFQGVDETYLDVVRGLI